MTAVVQDTAPQLGGDLDMNGHNLQGVTPTEIARVSGVTSPIQGQLDSKSATGHNHSGVYEPIDATLLRQSNFAGSGAAVTPARSDHNHTSISGTAANLSGTPALPNGTTVTTQAQNDASQKIASTAYVDMGLANREPADATIVKSAGTRTLNAITVFDANGKVIASGCKVVSNTLTCGDGTAAQGVILGEFAVNGTNDFRIYGATDQSADGCIVLSGPVGSGEALVGSASTATIDGKTCRVMTATAIPIAITNLNQIATRAYSDLQGIPSTFAPVAPGASTLGGVKSGQCTTTTGKLMGYDTNGDRICESDVTGGAGTDLNTATGDIATAQIEDGAVTAAKTAAALKTRTCEVHIWGSGASGVLQDTDDELASCRNKTGATLTITSVECRADAGTPTFMATITGGSNILSGNLTAGTATWAAGSLSGTPTQAADATIDFSIVAAGGTAKGLICVIGRTL
jgi:hypothetical protein